MSLEPSNPPEPGLIPEHMVVLLLEGGQRFLAKAEEAGRRRDVTTRDFFLKKIDVVLKELHKRLNHAEGGDLVNNLIRLYDWWGREIPAAAAAGDIARLKLASEQMGEIRRAWEFVLFQGEGMSESPEL